MRRLSYLCLQATREGQASYAHVHEIIDGLRRRGWRVELFEPRYKVTRGAPSALRRAWEFVRTQLNLWRADLPDVLYIRCHFAAWPTALWARLNRIPVVQEVNGPYEDLFLAWPGTRLFPVLFKWLIRTQLQWADTVICVTPQLKQWVFRESRNPQVHVIPNGVNTELFSPDAASVVPLPNAFAVFFGALAPWQGIATMLEATERPEWPSDVKLLILGDGVERSRVEEATRWKKVIYLGTMKYIEVPGIVAKSIASLIPKSSIGDRSTTGLYPLKVFESLGCGVPVIVSDFPGQADLVRSARCGLVVEPDDPRALAQAVAHLYEQPQLRSDMGKRGRELVVSRHQWDMRAEQTALVLDSTLRRIQN